MMKFIIPIVLTIGLTFSLNLFADKTNYSDSGNIEKEHKLWLTGVPNHIKVSQLSLPGTHDSITYKSSYPFVQTQALSLTEQLKSGIRVLDIRVQVADGKFAVHHGSFYLHRMFGSVLDEVRSFLNKHKGEVVFMRISKTGGSVGNHAKILQNYISKHPTYFWKNSSSRIKNPTVGEIRGKIVILRKDGWIPSVYGIMYPEHFQDRYSIGYKTSKDEVKSVSDKIKYAKKLLSSTNKNPKDLAINYLSATGIKKGLSPQDIAKKVNPAISKYINTSHKKQIGMIMMDFPGGKLIDRIIRYNKFYDMGYHHERFMADINGDGNADYCREVGDDKHKYYSCSLSNGSHLTREFRIKETGYKNSRQFVDIDGNGTDDFCREVGNRPHSSWIKCTLFSKGKGKPDSLGIVVPKIKQTVNFNRKLAKKGNWLRTFIDINHDGKADLCRGIKGGFKCYLFNNSSANNSRKGGAYFGLPSSKEVVFKLANKGDYGISDFRELAVLDKGQMPWFCRKLDNNTINCKQLKVNKHGKGSFEKTHKELAYDAGYNGFKQIVDINNDGKYEYCREVGERQGHKNKNRIECVRGKHIVLSVPRKYLGYHYFRQFADFNGDHKMEYIRSTGDEPNTFLTISKYKRGGHKLVIPTGINHFPGERK